MNRNKGKRGERGNIKNRGKNQGGGGGGRSQGGRNQPGRLDSRRPNDRTNQFQRPTTVVVEGFDYADEPTLMKFLKAQARRKFTYTKFDFVGLGAHITLPNSGQAQTLVSLNGVKFSDSETLKIRLLSHSKGAGPLSIQEEQKLKEMVLQCCNPDLTFLNMSGFADNQYAASVRPDFNRKGFVSSLLNIMKNNLPQLVSLDLSGNHIRDLSAFLDIHNSVPTLKNLNLSNNLIDRVSGLDALQGLRINELILTANPLQSDKHRSEIGRKFQSLTMLDGTPYDRLSVVSVDISLSVPAELPNFFENPEVETLANIFVNKFFQTYDSQRQGLSFAYAPNAYFSLVAVRKNPRPGAKDLNIIDYQLKSRNLFNLEDVRPENKSKAWTKRVEQLHVTRPVIVDCIQKLPSTNHLIQNFSVDAWKGDSQTTSMIFVVVHGTFIEGTTRGNENRKSFDRTFVLVPGGEQERQNGWDAMIINDQLVIRGFTGRFYRRPAARNESSSMQTSQSSMQTIAAPAPQPEYTPLASSEYNPQQQTLINQLMAATKMNEAFSAKCLEDSQWNLQLALEMFELVRSQLPEFAFQF